MIKKKTWRCKAYLDWVKRQACVITGAPADDAHHVIGVGHLGGMGTKAPDWATMPMTRCAHGDMHSKPEFWPDQWEYIARTLGKAIDDGVLVFNEKAGKG